MDWDAIKKKDPQWIAAIWLEARAEMLFEAWLKSRNLAEWTRYLEEHPPSPEALAIALMLGREKYESTKGRKAGLASGKARLKTARCTPESVAKECQTLMATGTEKRDVAAKLANRFKVTPDHIRKLLKKAANQT